VHMVGFTIEIYFDARSYKRQICIRKPFCFREFRVNYASRKVGIGGLSAVVFAAQFERYLKRQSEECEWGLQIL